MSVSGVSARLREHLPTVSVGLLAADLSALGEAVRTVEAAGARLLHFDVMDGVFCPCLTWGPPVIRAVKTSLLKDIHLMVVDPLPLLSACVEAGADLITIHPEGLRNPHRVLEEMRCLRHVNEPDREILRGVALNPGTPLEVLEPLLPEVDVVWLLSVNPGGTSPPMWRSTAQRMRRLLEMVRQARRDLLVGVDGGVRRDNIAEVVRMGADLIVAGSAVFEHGDPAGNLRFLFEEIRLAARRS